MASRSIVCVVEDGTSPSDGTLQRTAARQDITWPIGDGGTIALSVLSQDGTPYDLDGCTLTFVARLHVADATPVLAYDAVIDPTPEGGTAPGTGTVTVLDDDTALLAAGVAYLYDVRLVDDADVAHHVVPASKLWPVATIARSGEPEETEPAP